MQPIRSFQAICRDFKLNLKETETLQSLVDQRKGVLHAYWIQLTLYIPYSRAIRLYDELIANEWAVPDKKQVDGVIYESELTGREIEIIAQIELIAVPHCINEI